MVLVGVHQRGRGKGRHRRLADREQMRALAGLLADQLEELDQIIDIIVEIEAASDSGTSFASRQSVM